MMNAICEIVKLYYARLIITSIANFPVGPNALCTSNEYENRFSRKPASASKHAEPAEKKPDTISKIAEARYPPFAKAFGKIRIKITQ